MRAPSAASAPAIRSASVRGTPSASSAARRLGIAVAAVRRAASAVQPLEHRRDAGAVAARRSARSASVSSRRANHRAARSTSRRSARNIRPCVVGRHDEVEQRRWPTTRRPSRTRRARRGVRGEHRERAAELVDQPRQEADAGPVDHRVRHDRGDDLTPERGAGERRRRTARAAGSGSRRAARARVRRRRARRTRRAGAAGRAW